MESLAYYAICKLDTYKYELNKVKYFLEEKGYFAFSNDLLEIAWVDFWDTQPENVVCKGNWVHPDEDTLNRFFKWIETQQAEDEKERKKE